MLFYIQKIIYKKSFITFVNAIIVHYLVLHSVEWGICPIAILNLLCIAHVFIA